MTMLLETAGKNENEEKRELIFREDGQGDSAAVMCILYSIHS